MDVKAEMLNEEKLYMEWPHLSDALTYTVFFCQGEFGDQGKCRVSDLSY